MWRLLIGLLVMSGPTAVQAGPPEARTTEDVVDQIRSQHDGIALWWMGNAGWLIRSDGLLIGIDLDLGADEKVEPPPISASRLAPLLDVALATHHHGDHCHIPTIRTLARQGEARFVLPRPCLERVTELGIPPDRVLVPQPGRPFEIEGLRVEPTHAIHGNQDFTVLTREPDFVDSIAHNCGYVLNTAGRRLFHPGDSVLTEEHLELEGIDVLFVSPTVHNMYVDRSMILINRLEPAYVFPQHFGTYRQTDENAFWTRGYPDELRQRLSRTLQERYHELRPGEMFVVPPVGQAEGGRRRE